MEKQRGLTTDSLIEGGQEFRRKPKFLSSDLFDLL
jgi:hypothetical protein